MRICLHTNDANYIGAKSELTLPTNVSADSVKGIKPEFFLGMYKGSYGLDIGVVYENSAFRLFYWSSYGLTPHPWDGTIAYDGNKAHPKDGIPSDPGSRNDPAIGALPGEKITLKAYLNGSKVTCEAIRSNGNKTTLNCPLSPGAKAAFAAGTSINRELNIAANKPATGDYANPCNVYFYNACFSNGYVTTVGQQPIKLNDDISWISRDKEVDNYVNKSILKKVTNDCWYDTNGYSYEYATCDFNKK